MLLRDRYIEDTAMQYFPDFSMNNYLSHLIGLKPHYKYIMSEEQRKNWNNKLSSVVPASLFIASLIPIIFHKKIPKLKNFTSVKARILFALLYMVFPVGAGTFISFTSQNEIMMKYQLNFQEFKRYRLTGDPTIMNKNIRFYEDM